MRYDKQTDRLFVDAIEVKTRDNSADVVFNPDGTVSGHAAEQVATIIGLLREIFGQSEVTSEDIFVTARKEVLKYQIVSECFRKTHAPDSQETWAQVFRRAFSPSPSVQIEIGGILYHFDLGGTTGGFSRKYAFTGNPTSGIPSCNICVHKLTAIEIQKEIFELESKVSDETTTNQTEEENYNTEYTDIIEIAAETTDNQYSSDPTETTDNTTELTDISDNENKTKSDSTAAVSDRNVSEKITNPSTRFLLGVDIKTEEKYYWEFGNKNLKNRHLLINGNSGSGKTYCIQALLLEAVSNGVSAVVFDYTGGFTNSKLDPVFKSKLQNKITQRLIKTTKVPINPFQKHDNVIDEDTVIPEDDIDIANKISAIFAKIYTLGDQQKSAIYKAVTSGLSKFGENMTFGKMATELEKIGTSHAKNVLSKIQSFIDMDPFDISGNMNWGDIRDSGGTVYVVQLVGFERDVQVLLTELLLWDIWSFCVKDGNEEKPFIIVLDEAQNLDHGEKSPSAKILTEGRKYGMSGWYATQFMKPQLEEDEIQRLQQADQKLYFCPPDDAIITVAKNIDISVQGSKEWAEKLKKLKKGECVTCGFMLRNDLWSRYNPRVIKISALEDR